MDYYSLKRRELQALCKENNIPANSANSVLADKLSALFNEKQKPKARQRTCIKSSVEATDEGEPAASKRPAKKVRFSPNNDLVEYELRSGEKQKDTVAPMKTRRKSMVNKPVVDNNITVELAEDTAQFPVRATRRKSMVNKPVVDDNITADLVEDTAQISVRATRSRVKSSGKDVVIPDIEKKRSTGKKKGRREAKDAENGTSVDKKTETNVGKVTRSKVHTLEKGGGVQPKESKQSKRLVKEEEATETVEETAVGRGRVTRSKVTLMEGGTGCDANPHVKKKTGKQVKTDGLSVESSKEIMDIPVRATRSTRQSLKEVIGNTVTNPQADKKRTRREMKATDLSSNSSHVAPVVEQELSKRKSLRTRGAETVDEGEGDKMEVVNDGRVTRSNVPLVMEASRRNSRNKANKVEIQQLEVPLKHAGKKNLNRRKSVLQPEKTEVDLHIEEPVNTPARKNTRRKSVMQKATKTVESPTVEEKQSKGLSGNIEDKENVTRSGKDASENDFEEVTIRTPKSRKRSGTPIIEDHIIEPENGSLVDRSPKISTRSASKSEGKSVAKKQVESSLKKPMSRMNNKSSAGNASLEAKSSAIRSGAIIRDSTSKKRAKLSETKQSDSEDHAVEFHKEGTTVAKMRDFKTPVAKMRDFNLDEGVNEPEVTPVIDKLDRRFTRSAIKSEKKEPMQSAIKEQPIADSSSKKSAKLGGTKQSDSEDHAVNFSKEGTPVAKMRDFKLDGVTEPEVTPAIDKSDRHFTRSAIRSERKEPSQSAIKEQPIADSTYKKSAKLSVTKQSDSEDHPVNFSKEGTPVANFKLDEEVTEFEVTPMVTPAIENSDRRFTCSAIRSERKEPSQSAIKEQSIAEAQLFSPKVPKFKPDPAVNTAPGRVSRRGIKHSGNVAGSFSERVGKKKQTRQSAHKKQFLDDAQMALPKVTEVGFEISKGVKSPLGDVSASESVRSAINMERANVVFAENASGEVMEDAVACSEKSTYVASATPCLPKNLPCGSELLSSDNETPLGKNLSHIKMTSVSIADVAEIVPDAISDVSNVQNQNEKVYVESGMFSEDVNLEISVLKSGKPDARAQVMESTESGSTSKGMQTDVMIEEPVVSAGKAVVVEEGVDLSSLGVATKGNISDAGNNSDPIPYDVGSSAVCHSSSQQSRHTLSAGGGKVVSGSLQISSVDKHDDIDDGEQYDEDVNTSAQKPLVSGPDSEDRGVVDGVDVQENLCPDNDTYGACYSAISDRKSFLHVIGTPLIGKGDVQNDDLNVPKNLGTGSELSNANKTLEVPVSSTDIDIERALEDKSDVHDGESENQLASNDNHATDEVDVGGDGSVAVQNESMPSVAEVLVRSCDKEPEQLLNVAIEDVSCDKVGQPDSVVSKDAAETLATNGIDDIVVRVDASEESVVEINKDVVSSVLGDTNDMDADDSGNEQKLTEIDKGFQPNEDRGIFFDMSNDQTKEEAELTKGNDHTLDLQEPGQLLNVALENVSCDKVGQPESATSKDAPETLATSGIDDKVVKVDAPEDSVVYINKDVVSSVLGDTNDMDAEGDSGNEQKLTEFDEDFQPNESGGIFFHMSNGQTKEETETSRGNGHTLNDREQAAATDDDSDSGKFVEDGSHIAVNEVSSELVVNIKADEDLTREEASPMLYTKETTVDGTDSSQPMGDIRGHESLITKESSQITYKRSPVDDTDSDLPTIKEDDRNKQEGQNAGAFVDWGDYDFGMDEFEKPVSANRSADMENKDDQDSDLQTSARISSYTEESSGLEAGLANSVRKLEKDSRNASDGKSNQEVDTLKESANAADMTEVFNWPGADSSLKSLFATPAATRIGCVRDSQEDPVKLPNQDSSLKSLFATPATSRTSHVNECKTDEVNFTFPGSRCKEDIGSSRTAAHEFNHQWEDDQSKVLAGETQGNVLRGSENEIHGVPSFEDYSFKLFEDEVGGSIDQSGSNTHFEFKQFESLNEAAATSHHDSSGLKDNSARSCEFEKKDDTPMKGSEVNDDLVFDTAVGHAYDYKGSSTRYSNK